MKTNVIKNLLVAVIMLASFQSNAQLYNTRYGTNALVNNNGSNNSAFGHSAMRFNNGGTQNTAVGFSSLWNNTAGSLNTAIGSQALVSNQDGSYNSAVGGNALFNNTQGSYNTAAGYKSMFYNTSGNHNSAYGASALEFNTTGYKNSAFGVNALNNNRVGLNNSAFGTDALRSNYAGFDNAALGVSSLHRNSGGYQNTSVGAFALQNNVDGNYNAALGYGALLSNIASSNTAAGAYALYNNTYGTYNTVVGYGSGLGITAGGGNTIIGANVTGLNPWLSNTIILADGNGTQRLYIDNTGKTRIGESLTMPGTYRLYVKDGILTEKVVIAVANSTEWADYVFAPEYKLMPLTEVARFVKENNHLPNVSSAEEVVKAGIDVAKMDAKLLEKIEELTLYLIEQNTKNESLIKEVNDLKNRMTELEPRKARK